MPGIDFVKPNYSIQEGQDLLPNLSWSVFFANTPRVDRCVVCHKGIDNPDPAFADLGKETVTLTTRASKSSSSMKKTRRC